jgi:hypothetical protein
MPAKAAAVRRLDSKYSKASVVFVPASGGNEAGNEVLPGGEPTHGLRRLLFQSLGEGRSIFQKAREKFC